jgi:hypothetical protein
VIVGASGLALQGLKAAWDLYFAVMNHKRARTTLQLQEINALVHLIDGLPLDNARKAARKAEIIRSIKKGDALAMVHATVEKAVQDV